MTSHPEFVQRRKHIDRKLFLLDSPFLRFASVLLCKLVCQVAQPQIDLKLTDNKLIPGFQSASFRSEGRAGRGVDLLKS